MVEFLQKVAEFIKNFWPLFVVLPWEAAVRARAGKHVALLGPGVHWRIPFFDVLTLVNTRMRFVHSDLQALSTKDGSTLTASFTVVLERLKTEAVGYEFEVCQPGDFGYIRTYRLIQQHGSAGWCEIEERQL